jgi:hypothetical protein
MAQSSFWCCFSCLSSLTATKAAVVAAFVVAVAIGLVVLDLEAMAEVVAALAVAEEALGASEAEALAVAGPVEVGKSNFEVSLLNCKLKTAYLKLPACTINKTHVRLTL